MLYRTRWWRILRRNKQVLRMESSENLRWAVKRWFFIGLGLGTGLAAAAYLLKRLSDQNNNRELVLALNEVANELKTFRVSVVQHFERTASPFSNEQALGSKRRFKRSEIKCEVVEEAEALPKDYSSSDDDFFDLLDEEEQLDINDDTSLQDRSRLKLEELIQTCDELYVNNTVLDNEKEIGILEDLLERNPDNIEVLWRCARAYKSKADFDGENETKRKESVFKGLEYIDKAMNLKTAENHEPANKWSAVILGMVCEVAPLKETFHYAQRFKEHILKAIELNPQDSTNYYMLGRWCFGVAEMSWWQRQAAIAFLGEPPTSSMEEALSNFEQTERLVPGECKTNMLYIAKCHQCLGDIEKAKDWLTKALELPVKDFEDRKSHEEATIILQSL